MRAQTYLAVFFSLTLVLPALAQQVREDEPPRWPDHTIWVHIVSDPPEVDIFSIPPEPAETEELTREELEEAGIEVEEFGDETDAEAEGEAEVFAEDEADPLAPIKLGTTPCVVVIDMAWGTAFGKKDWDNINVWSAGGACQPRYNEEDKSYDFLLMFRPEKEGYVSKDFKIDIGSVTYPGYWWNEDDMGAWTAEKKINITLKRDPAATRKVKRRVPTVVIAKSSDGDSAPLGTLLVECNKGDAQVYVDREHAGVTPINLVMPEGVHEIMIFKDGYKRYIRRVRVPGDKKSRLKAELKQPS